VSGDQVVWWFRAADFSPIMQQTAAPSHLADIRVGGKYRFGRKIGSGSFGEIYLGLLDSFQVITANIRLKPLISGQTF
jgi:hypothetical protein